MAVIVICPGCQTKLTLSDDAPGTTVTCPECDESIKVPEPKPRAKPVSKRQEEEYSDDPDDPRPKRRRARLRGNDAAEAFVWWAQRCKGNAFPFTCPDCRNTVKIRQRKTQKVRTCPGCGFKITVEEIDKQLEELEPERERLMNQQQGCAGAVLLFLIPALALGSLMGCSKPADPQPAPAPNVVIGPEAAGDSIPPPHELPIAAEPSTAEDALEVFLVRSSKGAWKVQYPNGQRVVLGGSDKLTEEESKALGKLVLPVNRSVKFTVTAEDGPSPFEILSFALAFEVPSGKYTQAGVKPTRTGEYAIRSGRERVGTVLVVNDREFDDWLLGLHATEPPAGGTLAFKGRQLFLKLQCINCHSADAKAKAPKLEGLFGTKVPLKGGGTETADEDYIKESIRKPRTKVVDGWEAIMPAYDHTQASEEDLNALVAYIRSLRKGEVAPPREKK